MAELIIMIMTLLIIALGFAVYFLPSIIAFKKQHVHKGIILLVNFIFGWTFIVWVGLLVWAIIDSDGSKTSNLTRNIGGNKYEDISKLQQLKESGAISEEEFNKEKEKLLH